jgi:hypothetical protein
MAGKSRIKAIILLPFISIIFIAGWILSYLGSSPKNYKSFRARILAEQVKINILQRQLTYAIIEEREGIMLVVLGIFALTPLILRGGFPSWAYISAGFFTILGSVAMTHGGTRKNIVRAQLFGITRKT